VRSLGSLHQHSTTQTDSRGTKIWFHQRSRRRPNHHRERSRKPTFQASALQIPHRVNPTPTNSFDKNQIFILKKRRQQFKKPFSCISDMMEIKAKLPHTSYQILLCKPYLEWRKECTRYLACCVFLCLLLNKERAFFISVDFGLLCKPSDLNKT